jgi:hypothetical protein
MICVRQVRLIEDHWETIAHRALRRIRLELPEANDIPDAMIQDRVKDLLSHLGEWLTKPERELLASRYEALGQLRADQDVPMHTMVRATQLIRQAAVDYMLEHEARETALTAREESDLEYRIAAFFDLAVYHFVLGYEKELRAMIPAKALSERQRMRRLMSEGGLS